MRKLYIIGIGAGNPEYLTMQAIKALNLVDVFFFMNKGDAKEDLVERAMRKRISSISERRSASSTSPSIRIASSKPTIPYATRPSQTTRPALSIGISNESSSTKN